MDSEQRDEQGPPPVPRRGTFELLPGRDAGEWKLGPPDAGPDPEGVDWRYLLHVLWRRKWWIAVTTALGVLGGFYLAQQTQAVFETRSTVWVETGDDGQGPIQAQEVFEGQGWSDLLTSYAVLEPVARELDLYLDAATRASPLAEGFAVTDDVKAGQYRLEVDGNGRYTLATADGRVVDRGAVGDSIGTDLGFRWAPAPEKLSRGTTLEFSVSTPAQAASSIRANLNVLYDPRAGNLITTQLTWHDPGEAARILNQTVSSFLEVAADLKSKKLREVVDILERQTEYAEERLREAELALENARVENITLPTDPHASPIPGAQSTRGPVFDAYFERKLRADRLQSDLEQLTSALEGDAAVDSLDVLRLQGLSALGRSSELQASLEELAQKKAERRSLLYDYTERHPDVEEVTEEIRTLTRQTLPQQVRELASDLRTEIAAVEEGIRAQESELRQVPPRLIEEERLRREMEQAEKLHSDLLSRLKSAQLSASTSRPNLQVVDRAQPPASPTSDNGPRLFLMASLAGLGLGVGGVLLHDRMDNRVRQPEDIQEALGLPVLGLVPRIPSGGGKQKDVTPVVLESFRSIRAQLTRCMEKGKSTILITSPEPRDGKSLVAANLAISFASSRRTTLLVDGDTRRGNAHRMFDLPSGPGLTDFLRGEVGLPDVLRATDVPGLFVLPRGSIDEFDPDRLDGREMEAMFDFVRERFDTVVVDAPPLGAGADAMLLGDACDLALLVLRTGATDREVARARLEATTYFDFPLVGTVLNDVPDSAPYYRYYSPYRYYLEEGEKVS